MTSVGRWTCSWDRSRTASYATETHHRISATISDKRHRSITDLEVTDAV
jgi:hypothetical protein